MALNPKIPNTYTAIAGNVSPVDTQITALSKLDGNIKQIYIDAIFTDTTSILKSNLLTLVSTGQLKPKQSYNITDSVVGGNIIMTALTNNTLSDDCIWLRPTKLAAFGIVGILSGAAGSINSVTIDGVNIMSAPVAYTTSLNTTATNVQNNINAFTGTSGYRCVSINNYLVIIANVALLSSNGKIVSGTSTTLILGNELPLANGSDSTLQSLNVMYNISNDTLSSCSDKYGNVVTTHIQTAYNHFSWGDIRFYNNKLFGSFFENVFLYSGLSFDSNKTSSGSSITRNFLALGSGAVAVFQRNCFDSASSFFNNIIITPNTSLSFVQSNQLSCQGRISNNTLVTSGTGSASIWSNTLSGPASGISGNTGGSTNSSVNYQIWGNKLLGPSSSISNNTGSTGLFIRYNTILGFSGTINNNSFQTISNMSDISYNIISGISSTINNNTFNSIGCSITKNNLLGENSGINLINLTITNASILNNNITAKGGIITNINFDTVFNILSNIEWTDSEYSFSFTTPALNGAANLGQFGSAITIGYVPNKWYPYSADLDSSIIVAGVGSTLEIGIETDSAKNILNTTTVTTISNTLTTVTPLKTKATQVRRIIALPGTADITAGAFKLIVKGRFGI